MKIQASNSAAEALSPADQVVSLNQEAWQIRRSYPSLALQLGTTARQLAEQLEDLSGLAYSYRNTGTANYLLSLYDEALEDLSKAIPLFEKVGNHGALATTIRTIGNVYHSIEQNEKAIDNYHRALAICEKLEDDQGAAYNYGNIGYVLQKQGKYDEALEHIFKAVHMMDGLEDHVGLADAFNNIGRTFLKTKEYDFAIHFFNVSLEKAESAQHLRGIASALLSKGIYHSATGNYDEALQQYEAALRPAREMGEKQLIYNILEQKALALEAQGKFEAALEAYKAYSEEKNQVMNKVTKSTLMALKSQNDLARSEQEKEIFRLRNIELVKASKIIEEKNKDIIDSIAYGKKLQSAMLPTYNELRDCFPQSFTFFRPRDVIGGDFYWLDCIGERIIFALGDCTGHGVPGAMMSMLGHNLLQQVVHDDLVDDPSKALRMMDAKLNQMLGKGKEQKALDGMDIILCAYHKTNRVLEFAAAKMPLYLVRNGKVTLYKGETVGLGDGFIKNYPFELQSLQLQPGDQLFFSSDGYADQFGGEEGKKFMRRRLIDLLENIADLPVDEQRIQIKEVHEAWKGNLEQVDDICVLGIKID